VAERLIVVGGGVRSGKSRFALDLAMKAPGQRVFVATAAAGDAEMGRRILAHQAERGDAFVTREAPLDLVAALEQSHAAAVLVVDCLTMYVSNWLLAAISETPSLDEQQAPAGLESQLAREIERVLEGVRSFPGTLICVTNEVGMGVVPASPLGRSFRDLLGLTNRRIAGCADELYLATLGVVLRLKPDPVTLVPSYV
jgi:adenosylcobinamide kinase / adenosylcobinamide-phosphate guanylyltransferase